MVHWMLDVYKRQQYNWIKEEGTENDEKKSNYYWYDKTGKKEEK